MWEGESEWVCEGGEVDVFIKDIRDTDVHDNTNTIKTDD